MSETHYSTGELAKVLGVSVRTVQYYDTRGILSPSSLSEGGRRLYSEEDKRKMKLICFLRELNLPLKSIGDLMKEEHPEKVLLLLLEQQKEAISEEIRTQKEQLGYIEEMIRGLRNKSQTIDSVTDIAHTMKNKKRLSRIRRNMLLLGVLIELFEIGAIVFAVKTGWWLMTAIVAVPLVVIGAIMFSAYYFKNVNYLCPECHTVFRPTVKEAFFARHTPTTRRLTCTCCGHKGFCIETAETPSS